MRALGDYYRTQLKVHLAVEIQYRAAMFIWLIGAILEPVIYLIVWNTVAKSQGGEVGGFTPGDFAAYFIVGMVVNQITFTWIMWEYEYYIRDGTLAANLLRPIHPIHADISSNLSYKVMSLVIMVPTVIVMVLLFHPSFNFQPWAVVAFVPALALAYVLRFSIEWTLAMAAFWTTRTSAVNNLYYVIFLFFSGRMAPLSLFPPAIAAISMVLPFRWMLAFPIDLFLGNLTQQEALFGFGMQLVWIALALASLKFVWSAAIQRFGAVGG